ncbi:L-aspartate oxidase [Moraxella atlantae]|uniref:L-aspartate oxidase n=2 Tax=Faucicola atlantae TaxID=34059 RepID=A0A378Q168_9GAMM|nr:L-aspartate oxidase [Moraxella atlantae]
MIDLPPSAVEPSLLPSRNRKADRFFESATPDADATMRPLTGSDDVTHFDVVIVGGGAAGLTLALSLPKHLSVAMLMKDEPLESSTYYAQGGVAAVWAQDDTVDEHIADTLIAGAGLCHEEAVRFTVEHSREAIEFLLAQGVKFTLDENSDDLHLTQEGGHSRRRIAHVADATGRAVATTLLERVRECQNVTLLDHMVAIDVITTNSLAQHFDAPFTEPNRAVGVYALDTKAHRVLTLSAGFVALACGGVSKAYLYTSNPDIATGDGIAMAWRAGCRVANLEFNQFHPTCLYHPEARSFLLTEALRGEGAYLRLPPCDHHPEGERFMLRFDSRGELAPRDIVALTIDFEMKRLGLRHVYLDITHKDPEFVKAHFPTLYTRLLEFGIDITQDQIPVVPAAHYTCGGVVVNRQGQTDVLNLYALGETSFTGLHGANRMASNSLLECFVYAMSAAAHIRDSHAHAAPSVPMIPIWHIQDYIQDNADQDEAVILLQNWDELRHTMWHYVGIVRSNKRLHRALSRILLLKQEMQDYYGSFALNKNLIELRNLLLVSELIVRCALRRHESRGLHYNRDFPQSLPTPADVVLTPAMPSAV